VNLQGPGKYNLISSIVPQSTGLNTQNFPQVPGMQIYEFDATTQRYLDAIEYYDGAGWSRDGENIIDPTFPIGQGFFLYNPSTGQDWTRDFTVQ
jgi:hypothetical protein